MMNKPDKTILDDKVVELCHSIIDAISTGKGRVTHFSMDTSHNPASASLKLDMSFEK